MSQATTKSFQRPAEYTVLGTASPHRQDVQRSSTRGHASPDAGSDGCICPTQLVGFADISFVLLPLPCWQVLPVHLSTGNTDQ
jgi:hypothetical protein